MAFMPLFVTSTFNRHVLCLILLWSIIGMGWNFIGGYAGQVSIGHSVFYGIGAYSAAIGFYKFNITPWIGMIIGIVISVIVASIIGLPLLRLKGHYFASCYYGQGECCRCDIRKLEARRWFYRSGLSKQKGEYVVLCTVPG